MLVLAVLMPHGVCTHISYRRGKLEVSTASVTYKHICHPFLHVRFITNNDGKHLHEKSHMKSILVTEVSLLEHQLSFPSDALWCPLLWQLLLEWTAK